MGQFLANLSNFCCIPDAKSKNKPGLELMQDRKNNRKTRIIILVVQKSLFQSLTLYLGCLVQTRPLFSKRSNKETSVY